LVITAVEVLKIVVGTLETRVVLLTTVLVVVGPGMLRVEVFVTVVGRLTVRVVLLTTVLVFVLLMISVSVSIKVFVLVLYRVTMLVCVAVSVLVIVRMPKARASRGLATTDDARVPNTRPLAKREPFIVAETECKLLQMINEEDVCC
jgi:hypothetical protein